MFYLDVQGLAELIDELRRNNDSSLDPVPSQIEGSSTCNGFKAIGKLTRRLTRAIVKLFAFILAAIL